MCNVEGGRGCGDCGGLEFGRGLLDLNLLLFGWPASAFPLSCSCEDGRDCYSCRWDGGEATPTVHTDYFKLAVFINGISLSLVFIHEIYVFITRNFYVYTYRFC